DKIIQNQIMNEISKLIHDAEFISEESASSGNLSAENLFIIDPIDGTTNFIHAMRYSAVSVAWYKKGIPFYGIVYNPYSEELYEAQCDKGAFLNGQRITVSSESLGNSIVAFGTSPYNLETTETTFELIKNMYGRCQDIRRMGSAALDICQVASGRVGLYFEAALSLWDYAAAQLILHESGGKMVDFYGKPIRLTTEKSSVIVGCEDIILESELIRKERHI
ncbi:MAG: inositol monophosphatase, partial [Ruminococcus sp.]|nr:inositol monophosphatase [Ruminococcus sp.]